MKFDYVTSDESVAVIETATGIFEGLLREIRELSKKKPDATMSAGKVKIINRVLDDLKSVLQEEDQGKYLDLLDDQLLPQNSDALLVMVQYRTAMSSFTQKYSKRIAGKDYWITETTKKHLER